MLGWTLTSKEVTFLWFILANNMGFYLVPSSWKLSEIIMPHSVWMQTFFPSIKKKKERKLPRTINISLFSLLINNIPAQVTSSGQSFVLFPILCDLSKESY